MKDKDINSEIEVKVMYTPSLFFPFFQEFFRWVAPPPPFKNDATCLLCYSYCTLMCSIVTSP